MSFDGRRKSADWLAMTPGDCAGFICFGHDDAGQEQFLGATCETPWALSEGAGDGSPLPARSRGCRSQWICRQDAAGQVQAAAAVPPSSAIAIAVTTFRSILLVPASGNASTIHTRRGCM